MSSKLSITLKSGLLAAVAGLVFQGQAALAQDGTVTVFAAASLTDAFTTIGDAYTAGGGGEVQFSFASSSTLARQIEAGAPADIFASANERWMDYLQDADLIDADTRVSPISNSLVLIAPADEEVPEITVDGSMDLAALLGPEGRIAVGDPDHVPAGIYAKEALENLGLWEEADPRLARADDVRAALALVEAGETPLGIVYSTDARVTEGVQVVGTFPADSHTPITYPFAILADHESDDVKAFFDYLQGPEAMEILADAGFSTH